MSDKIFVDGVEYARVKPASGAPKTETREECTTGGNSSPIACGSAQVDPVPAQTALALLKPHPRSLGGVLRDTAPAMRSVLLKSMGYTGNMKGPATVKVRLPLTPQAVSSNGAGQVQVVYGIQSSGIVQISDWTAVFKEYRFTSAEIQFVPSGVPVLSAADACFGAGLNYSANITAPGSIAEVLALDQGKIVGLGVTKVSKWHVDFEKLFGEVWTDTGTSVAFATWKAFNTATGNPLSVQLGNWFGFVNVEFRGLG